MRKIHLKKDNAVYVKIEKALYCDFCGERDREVFTSDFDEGQDSHKCEMQICFSCVDQLNKLITLTFSAQIRGGKKKKKVSIKYS